MLKHFKQAGLTLVLLVAFTAQALAEVKPGISGPAVPFGVVYAVPVLAAGLGYVCYRRCTHFVVRKAVVHIFAAVAAVGTVAFAITTLAKASMFGPPPDPVPSTMDLMLLVLAPAAIFFILSLAFNRIKRRGKRLNDGSNSSTAAIGAGSASSGKAKPDDAGGDGDGGSGDSDGGCGGGGCSGS